MTKIAVCLHNGLCWGVDHEHGSFMVSSQEIGDAIALVMNEGTQTDLHVLHTSMLHAFADKRKADEELDKQNTENIRKRGEADGKNAGEWALNDWHGTVKDAKHFLTGIEDGDPAVMDQLPHPQYSGEWADQPTWEDIVRDETDIDELEDDGGIELLQVYDEAFSDAATDYMVTFMKSFVKNNEGSSRVDR